MSSILEDAWTTEAGLRAACIIVGGRHRCGYVGVPREHALYGCIYDDLLDDFDVDEYDDSELCEVIRVHGGLNYSRDTAGSCLAEEGLWWFGFDCGHGSDGIIGEPQKPGRPIRSFKFVVEECERLARQIVELEGELE